MQQSPVVSLLLIVVHLFVTMAFLTGVSAETEIGRLTLLTSRPFTSQVTSVGVRERPNHGGKEGSLVMLEQTLAVVKNLSALPSNTQGEKKHLSREHLTRLTLTPSSVRDVRVTFPSHVKTPFEIPTKNKPISASATTAPFNSSINSTLPLASSFTGNGRKRTTTLTTEEEKTGTSLDTSPSRPPLCTTPPDYLLHLMKRDIKLSNAVVDLYGNEPSDAHSSRDANDKRPSKLLKNVTIGKDEEVCIFLKFHFFFFFNTFISDSLLFFLSFSFSFL